MPVSRCPLSSNRIALSSNESYPQYVVTAVIVAHDGAAWLPNVADALLDQSRAVQRVVAVDTGSRDRSGAVLASKFGQAAVFGMDRATGYGAAVSRALAHRAANLPVPGATGASGASPGDKVEWIWLLHDDCEPAPDALEQLLRGAAETKAAAVLGPKLRDWSNREVILEAGVTLDTAARRLTGIEPREVDQGQHDGDRDTLAVSSAGMLVRRDVWEQVGGFDAGMSLFMEDIDFCWRVHAAGYRVRVITDATCYHVQAATKRRRTISVGRRARMLDRRNGLLTLLGNLPLRQMLTAAVGNVVISLLRIAFFLLAKRLTAALDEAAALTSVLCHPLRLISMRRHRSHGRRAAYSRVKADLPPGRSMRRLAEFAASATMKSAQTDTTGAHHASADPTEDDSMLVDNGLGLRLLTSPALLSFILLTVISVVAGRSLIGSGPLGGGSLLPAWGGASDLWRTYLQSFHPSGLGSAAAAPPYLAVLAVLATVLAGKAWLAIEVVLIGCVPLAGLTAMLAVRRVATSAAVRVWASVTYALLPIAMGVVAGGRFGSAIVFVLLPLIALTSGRIVTEAGRRASRAAWASGLLVAVGAAFVPLLWLVALVGCVITAIVLRNSKPGLLRNLAIVALTAPVLLLPWTLSLISSPGSVLLEAGLPQPGSPATGLSGKMLLLLSPGGPGLPPYWVTAGLIAVALAALFTGRRRRLITAGWGVALAGMLLAIVTSSLLVNPPDGGQVVVWAGLPLAIAALGLLLAACAGADALGRVLAAGQKEPSVRDERGGQGNSGGQRGWSWSSVSSGRGAWVALIALVASSAPLLAAVSWLSTGVSGPVHPVTSQVVPELVAIADGQSRQVRTLVLRSVGGHISYLLLRGPSPSLGDQALTSPPSAEQALAKAVATLTTPDGGLAANQSQLLADFDIGYVLIERPVNQRLSGLLDDVSGLRPYSTTFAYSIWQLAVPPSRVAVLEPGGTMVSVAAGPVGVSGATVPVSGGTLLLAEPAGGWNASVNGHALTPVPSPAGSWAQAFKLPPGGGTLSLRHSSLVRDLWLLLEALALLAVVGLALPGIHVAEEAQRAEVLTDDADVGEADLVAAGARPGRPRAAGARAAGARAAGGRAAGARAAGDLAATSRAASSRVPDSRAAGSRRAGPVDDEDDAGVAEDAGLVGAGRTASGGARPGSAAGGAREAGAAGAVGAAGVAAVAAGRSARGASKARGKLARGRSGRSGKSGQSGQDARDRADSGAGRGRGRPVPGRTVPDRDADLTSRSVDGPEADGSRADGDLARSARAARGDQADRDRAERFRGATGRARADADDSRSASRLADDNVPMPDLADLTGDRPAADRFAGDRLGGDRLGGDRLGGDRLANGWPHADSRHGDEDLGRRRRRGDSDLDRAASPQARAWPYADDDGEAPDSRRTGWSARETDSLPGAGRESSRPDWPAPARPLPGRSPSGAAPPAEWSSLPGEDQDDYEPGRGGFGRHGSGRSELERREPERRELERREPERRLPGRYEPDRYESDRYESDRYAAERDSTGSRRNELDRYEPDRSQPGRVQPGRAELEREPARQV